MVFVAAALLAALAGGGFLYFKGRTDAKESFDIDGCIYDKIKKGYDIKKATLLCKQEAERIGKTSPIEAMMKYGMPLMTLAGLGYVMVKMIETASKIESDKKSEFDGYEISKIDYPEFEVIDLKEIVEDENSRQLKYGNMVSPHPTGGKK